MTMNSQSGARQAYPVARRAGVLDWPDDRPLILANRDLNDPVTSYSGRYCLSGGQTTDRREAVPPGESSNSVRIKCLKHVNLDSN